MAVLPPKQRRWSWRSQALRGVVYQVLAVALLAAAIGYLAHNTLANMRARGIQSGFDFITQPAGFAIGESLIPFDSSDSYAKAFLVGLSNTLRVSLVGIVLATAIGLMVGVGRLSRNPLVRGLCRAYVEATRNVPLLLQLFMWYFAITEFLPSMDGALQPLPHVFLSKAGLQFPLPDESASHFYTGIGFLLGIPASWGWLRFARARREATGRALPLALPVIALWVLGGLAGWWADGAPTALDVPVRSQIAINGGGAVTPEYLTVLLGLTIYTAGFISEVVRGGIQSVAFGQIEAASALGLSRALSLRLVQLPQALRVIIPPLTNQYLNLTKNSSLAVAVGYPDLVSISETSLNQTGRAVECITIVMAIYLMLSLLTSALMGWYNRRARLKER
ncbi:MAG: ABC transporter permease subunit [Burkholderiales bacterium]|nr:ABC transporter permease subunit [Burkholderiales bacterium]MDE1925578.1 ABC transporter permease subunit [Burkholderiales bacterium]MDE2158420.1 ABC transporter permease subunit [Burkholderiales bacterium]MDE2503261.1 ABC transporter permease subunit [Burkholderiales bacterium]